MKLKVLPPGTRLIRARFLERPNRFLVLAELSRGERVRAYLPNPGRLQELLVPEAELILVENRKSLSTSHTVLAAMREGKSVFLHTHLTNRAARLIINRGLVPGLERCRVKSEEVKIGGSRFDFLLRCGKEERVAEVKSCTLFGNRVAMFPDAVTARGKRHLEELASLSRRGPRPAVIFLAHTREADWFMPDWHTDLEFARAFLAARDRVQMLPLSVGWTEELELDGEVRLLEIPWDYLAREVRDRGGYLVVLELKRPRVLEVGGLGRLKFRSGWFIYAGSGAKNLSARAARHLRVRKKPHWHIDYLRAAADRATALLVRTSERIECEMAADLGRLFARGPRGFGSSDCGCETHLFYSPENPLHLRGFHSLLMKFRMKAPR